MVTHSRRVHRERGASNNPSRESSFTAKSGFTFNIDTPNWDVDRKRTLTISRLDHLKLTERELTDLRYAFAVIATTRPYGSVNKFLSGVINSNIQSLTSGGVTNIKSEIGVSQVDSLKAIARELKKIDKDYYANFHDEIFSLRISEGYDVSSIYDVETGALSEYEFGDLTEKLNIYSSNVDTWHDEADSLRTSRHHTSFSTRERLLVARFTVIFSRRPSQIAAIKWCDLSITQTELGDELELSVPMIKQGDDFREAFEVTPLKLLHDLAIEVFNYRKFYLEELKTMLERNNIKEVDLDKIMSLLPLFPEKKLFDLEVKSKEKFLTSFGEKSPSFHLTSDNIKTRFNRMMDIIRPESDRLSPENYRIGNNRLRHTAGTTLAMQGYDALSIAQSLGNTPYSARFYVDMSDEVRVSIDEAFKANTLLSKSFSGSLTSEITAGEVAIEDMSLRELGKSTRADTCEKCTKARPIGCYGCNSFRPLITADHKSKLLEVENLYEKRKKSGNSIIALSGLRRTIIKIKATIQACSQARTSLMGRGK
ncbi:hypothetical protein [Agarivorans sp. DSG3-1]|uniref:hypothetical protein n=1 Tax=Agarivorans sp. DSG3-1 TaxID=3342249 RepID=UPI00398EE7FA